MVVRPLIPAFFRGDIFKNQTDTFSPTSKRRVDSKRRTYPIRARRGSHGRRERRHRPGRQSGGFLHPALRRVSGTTSGGHDVSLVSSFFASMPFSAVVNRTFVV